MMRKKTLLQYRLIVAILFVALLFVACKHSEHKNNIETEQISLSKVFYLTDARLDSIRLQFEIEFPTQMDDKNALENIQKSIIGKVFGDDYCSMSLDRAMSEYITFSRDEYFANNRAFALLQESDEKEMAILSVEQVFTGRVLSADNGVLTYELEQYVYMGGAHGVNTRFFYNYDIESGQLLNENDIFIADFEEPISKLLQTAMVEQSEEFESSEDFIRAGFEFDSVRPNGNFAFMEDIVIYVFNPYEIAPYVFGETEITLDKTEINQYLSDKYKIHD